MKIKYVLYTEETQLVEHCTSIAEVMGSNPIWAWIFFFQVLFQLLAQ